MTDAAIIILWIVLSAVFLLAEAATAQLVTVWFAVGSIVSLFLAIFHVGSLTTQIIIFAAVSLLLLALTRPFVKKLMHKRVQPTNADRNVGQTGIVTVKIRNDAGEGEVNLKGVRWTARSSDNAEIEEGASVKVLRIEGVKLIVEPTN